MAAKTDQERAEFDAWWREYGLGDYDTQFEAWQASRRAQVVPKFSPVAQTKLGYLLEAGEVITGYAIENKDGRRGAIDCHGFVYWWNDAAPVQMPESISKVLEDCRSRAIDYATCASPYNRERMETAFKSLEHQVRQLLTAKLSAPSVDTIGVMPEPRWYSPSPGDAAHFPYYTPEDVSQILAQHGIK